MWGTESDDGHKRTFTFRGLLTTSAVVAMKPNTVRLHIPLRNRSTKGFAENCPTACFSGGTLATPGYRFLGQENRRDRPATGRDPEPARAGCSRNRPPQAPDQHAHLRTRPGAHRARTGAAAKSRPLATSTPGPDLRAHHGRDAECSEGRNCRGNAWKW